MLETLRKWYLKNEKDSPRRILEGVLTLVIYQNFPWLIDHASLASKSVSRAGLKTAEILKYEVTLSVFSLLGSVIISLLFVNYSKRIYRYYITRNSKLKILKASYFTQKNSVDITSELNQKIIDNKLKINLTNDIAGDPDKGTNKESNIKYFYNGKEFERNYKEYELIDLPVVE